MKNDRTQLGDRVPSDLACTLKALGDVLKISKQQLTEDAIALWMGKEDPMAESRRNMALLAFKTGKVDRPFDSAPDFRSVVVG